MFCYPKVLHWEPSSGSLMVCYETVLLLMGPKNPYGKHAGSGGFDVLLFCPYSIV